MKRRAFLRALAAVPVPVLVRTRRVQFTQKGARMTATSLDEIRKNWRALVPDGAAVELSTARLEKSQAEWKQLLDPAQFRVLREEGTEPPFTSPLNAEKRAGVFVCAGCSLPLFTSEMKFESGTGWPSFFTSIPGHLATKWDFKLVLPRTEYHCVRCGGHQGHVFEDGPPPTRERWCNNGQALRFLPKS